MTREQVIGVMGQALDDALDNGALTRLAQLNCIYDALAAAGMIVGGGEAVAWLHKVTEPDGSSHDLFSDSPNNPWSHWVEAHREQCIYAATPLYTHPTPSAQGYVLDWSWIRSVLAQGADIQKDYIAGNHETYEHYSARLDVAARERLDQLTASPPAPPDAVAGMDCPDCEGIGTVPAGRDAGYKIEQVSCETCGGSGTISKRQARRQKETSDGND